MTHILTISRILGATLAVAGLCSCASAPMPAVDIDPMLHGHLAAAQESIRRAFVDLDSAQRYNDDRLGGHAQRAKALLVDASSELKAAAEAANAR